MPNLMKETVGRVSLVGAGPGDIDHLTLGAMKAIQSAQAVLYDALISPDILELLPSRCIKICVGKRGDRLFVPQEKTNNLMVKLARKGLNVVRLKGGDPSIFGRVEEERQYLEAKGIDHTTIAGVTAASAAAAQFSFPLTYRSEARSVTFLTGRGKDGVLDISDAALANPETSLMFYMSFHHIEHIQQLLLRAQRQPHTPILIIENAGRPSARMISGQLKDLVKLGEITDFEGPVLIGVGDVYSYARNTLLNQNKAPLRSGSCLNEGLPANQLYADELNC